jgi:hypothetical protein
MSDIDNELLAKFEGRCWHEVDKGLCKHCGKFLPDNPSYSTSPADRERLLEYLMKKEEMYWEFTSWTYNVKDNLSKTIVMHFVWLMVPPPDSNVPRWVSLLSEFLGMESVREKFGWVECHGCDGKDSVPIECSEGNKECGGSGKIRAEWAKEG